MNPHYKELADSMVRNALERSKSAKAFGHPGMRGRVREIFAMNMLSPFLSPNVGICTGVIVDSGGNSSRQVDIIVYDKSLIPSMMFTVTEGVVPVESVLAAIEVKSRLTKSDVKSAVENAHSVKALRPRFREVSYGGPSSQFSIGYKSSILCCLFGFSSDRGSDKEFKRLTQAVSQANEHREASQKVYVPLSGVCVGNDIAILCKGIFGDPPEPQYTVQKTDAALHFLSFLVDQVVIMESQRRKMLMSHYFLEGE